jgi:uncharacterized protein
MGLNKHRKITFKPTYFHFGPLDSDPLNTLKLNDDELEALYLADFQGLYQEDCSKSLGVSRPTFIKILKSARRKTMEMYMFGKAIEVNKSKREFVLVFPTNDRISLHTYFITAKYFAFATIDNSKIVSISYKDNPIYHELIEKNIDIIDDESAKGMAAGKFIPPLLDGASILVTQQLGEGMKRNIEGMGINVKFVKEYNIDEIIKKL